MSKRAVKTWKADWNLYRLFGKQKRKDVKRPEQTEQAVSWIDCVSPVKQQGLFNACSVFASLAVMETLVAMEDDRFADDYRSLSEGFCYFKSPGLFKYITGLRLDQVLESLTERGVPPRSDFPYGLKAFFSGTADEHKGRMLKISSFAVLSGLYEIKKWLRERGPLISLMDYHPDFIFYREGIYKPAFGPCMGGHAVAVIGYDDGQSAWICKNSWGENWGEGGFFRIAYGSCGIDRSMVGIEGLVSSSQ